MRQISWGSIRLITFCIPHPTVYFFRHDEGPGCLFLYLCPLATNLWFQLVAIVEFWKELILSICRSPGYALIPQVQRPLADRTTVESGGEQGFIGQQHLQFSIHGGPSNLSFPQLPHCVFIPFQAPSASVYQGERAGSTPISELEAQKNFLQHQIEVSLSAVYRFFSVPGCFYYYFGLCYAMLNEWILFVILVRFWFQVFFHVIVTCYSMHNKANYVNTVAWLEFVKNHKIRKYPNVPFFMFWNSGRKLLYISMLSCELNKLIQPCL